MNLNYLSITFWFKIFNDHAKFISLIKKYLPNEFEEYKIVEGETNNYNQPILTFVGEKNKSNIMFSQISLQYNMNKVDILKFQENVLKIFDILTENGIIVLHTALFSSSEIICNDALNKITKCLLSSKLSNDLIDVHFKFGKKYEDIFYKIITILNEKRIEIPTNIKSDIPLPLISWNNANLKEEIIEIMYEINDKLSFDTEKNYHTTESYLNKMLYVFKNDMPSDINNLLNKGKI